MLFPDPSSSTLASNIPLSVNEDNHFCFGWDGVDALCESIVTQMDEIYYRPSKILALGRGAVIPGRLLARGDTPLFFDGVRSYKGMEQEGILPYQPCTEPLNSPDTLIVDDLWDTGETFRYAKKLWPMAKFAALLSKCPADDTFLDFIGLVLPIKTWIIFPWERY